MVGNMAFQCMPVVYLTSRPLDHREVQVGEAVLLREECSICECVVEHHAVFLKADVAPLAIQRRVV